jgi:hypothetical protein
VAGDKTAENSVSEPHPTEQIAGKKVIKPINSDFNKKPDLNALLAAEEQRAAVENPIANTIIKPLPSNKPEASAPNTPPPHTDEHSDIAL